MQLALEVPDQYLLDASAEELAQRFRLYAALMMFRAGQISAGAACELAAIDRYTFLKECRQHGISTHRSSPDELEAEVAWLSSATSAS